MPRLAVNVTVIYGAFECPRQYHTRPLSGASGIALNADETLLASSGADPTARGIVAKPPTQYALHANHVVRWLVAAGHVERALGYVTSTGAGGLDRVDLARFGLPHEQEAQMLAAFRGVVRRVQKRQPRRALQVVGRLRDLRLRAIEDGDPITVADLSEVLGDWR